MFDENIDVVKIMEEIKNEVWDEKINYTSIAEYEGIEEIDNLIANTRNYTKAFCVLGMYLPEIAKCPKIINKFIQLIARVIRKSSSFITRDQMIINDNIDVCIELLIERQNIAVQQANKKILELERKIYELEKNKN